MTDLNFVIENQVLNRLDSQVIVNKSRNYLKCYFKFLSSEWCDVEKFAIFKDENDTAYNVHLGTDNENNCLVPDDVLCGDFFKITVYGGNLITTNEKVIVLLNSGYTTDIQTPSENSEDIFNELFTKLNSKIDDVVYNDGILDFYSHDKLIVSVDLAYDDLKDSLMQMFQAELNNKLQDYVKIDGISFVDGILRFE